LLEAIREFETAFFKVKDKVDLIELKIANALIKKKLKEAGDSLEDKTKNTETSISPDGLDELRKIARENG